MDKIIVKKNKQEYRKSFRIKMLELYVSSQETLSHQSRTLGITLPTYTTIVKQELEKSGYYRILANMNKKLKENPKGKDLQKENEELRKALELARLKVAGLETMIEVAEEELKINIRKKSGAKQSK